MKLPVSRNETLTQLVPGLRSDPDSLVIGYKVTTLQNPIDTLCNASSEKS